MEQQYFEIRWLPTEALLDLDMKGFWPADMVTRFRARLTEAVIRAGTQTFDLLADLSTLSPQSAEVVVLQGGVIAGLVEQGMRRLAIAGAGPLLTMQVKRAAQPLVPFFGEDRARCRDWLRTIPA